MPSDIEHVKKVEERTQKYSEGRKAKSNGLLGKGKENVGTHHLTFRKRNAMGCGREEKGIKTC